MPSEGEIPAAPLADLLEPAEIADARLVKIDVDQLFEQRHQAEEALSSARDAGRSVLDELRELLAVLRDDVA